MGSLPPRPYLWWLNVLLATANYCQCEENYGGTRAG
jgi:hypothetical protein